MRRKLPGYFLLSFFSFCVFTGVFHTIAHAQDTALISPKAQNQNFLPTPTLYTHQFVEEIPTAPTLIPHNIQPTPTIFTASAQTSNTSDNQAQVINEYPIETPEPTAIPTPEPTIALITDLDSLFDKYSSEFGVDKVLLKKIAQCESGFNTTSNNSGLYLGMYQFANSTWVANRNRMGLDSNPDLRTNAEESIRTAAYVISKGGQGAWPNCN